MANSAVPLLLLFGAGALLVSRKKVGASTAELSEGDLKDEVLEEADLQGIAETIDETEHPQKEASLGRLYQVRPIDDILTVAQEALYGTRHPFEALSEEERIAVLELALRIDCAPWNQALYAVPVEELEPDHPAIESEWSTLGVSFRPVYSANRARMLSGRRPTAEEGNHYAYIWIPMIDLIRFESEGVITVEGMVYEDTENGRGHSMIDPPLEILELGFEEVAADQVGCKFPEGDFRRSLEDDD